MDKIIVPHEYEADFRKYAEDIAMLVLKDDFFLSKVVRPVCFRNIQSIHLHPGSKGVVIFITVVDKIQFAIWRYFLGVGVGSCRG